MSEHFATFGNLICKFGQKNLRDFSDQLVVPAMLDDEFIKEGESGDKLFFYDVNVGQVELGGGGVEMSCTVEL